MLPGIFSSVQPALKPRWRNAESDEETLNLDGGTLTVDEGTLTVDEGTRPSTI